MPLVKTKCLGQIAERIEEQRENSDFQYALRFRERKRAREVGVRKFLLNEDLVRFFEGVFLVFTLLIRVKWLFYTIFVFDLINLMFYMQSGAIFVI